MSKPPVQHYVSKMFIKRFMNGRTQLYTLDVDNLEISTGTIGKSFGIERLWSKDIETKLGILESKVGKVFKYYDNIKIEGTAEYQFSYGIVDNIKQRDAIIKLALLEPKLLIDLKDGKKFEKNILSILDNDFSLSNDTVFYIKLDEEYCNGKFVITDYLGQNFINIADILNSSTNNTNDDLQSGNIKGFTAPISYYFITGEYELFFVGEEENMYKFLESIRRPSLILQDKNGKEHELKKNRIDNFELTAFNLNEIKSQESQCVVGCYDKDYLELIKDSLPSIISEKVMFRNSLM